jgi:hypothetical protein
MENPLITDRHVVDFTNSFVRPSADLLSQTANTLRRLSSLANSKGIAALLGSDPTLVIDDGADVDGRTPITVGDVLTMLGAASLLTALSEATDAPTRAGIAAAITSQTTTTSLRTTTEKIAVNGQSIF